MKWESKPYIWFDYRLSKTSILVGLGFLLITHGLNVYAPNERADKPSAKVSDEFKSIGIIGILFEKKWHCRKPMFLMVDPRLFIESLKNFLEVPTMFDICSKLLIKAFSKVCATNTKSVWVHGHLMGCPLCLAGFGKSAGLHLPFRQKGMHSTSVVAGSCRQDPVSNEVSGTR